MDRQMDRQIEGINIEIRFQSYYVYGFEVRSIEQLKCN